jgi:hypothetical protein
MFAENPDSGFEALLHRTSPVVHRTPPYELANLKNSIIKFTALSKVQDPMVHQTLAPTTSLAFKCGPCPHHRIGNKFSWADPQIFLRSPWHLCPLELEAEDSSVVAPKPGRNIAASAAGFPCHHSEWNESI